jgi:nicotinate-nucleotide--dimethylbenzimidazole phosphoribosyltransferase
MFVAPFKTLQDFETILSNVPAPDPQATLAAQDRNGLLTKPPAALGRLEDLAIWVAGWQGTARPVIKRPQILVFAGNHGVAALGVSAFPAEVTEQMVQNFQTGGAAINQLAKTFGAQLNVVPLQLSRPTADFTKGPAMTEAEVLEAITTGWNSVHSRSDILIVGEMGIGNTTSAAAMAAAILGGESEDWTGRGTGVSDDGLQLKAQVVRDGLAANPEASGNGIAALRCLGGREVAAMAGAIACARYNSIPLILDGFIATAAAACLHVGHPYMLEHCVAGHRSAEAAHAKMLKLLKKEPLLSLDLRLGEGSGAALALPILQAAVACHSGMATFSEAGVSDKG